MAFLLDEDEAMKNLFSGLTIPIVRGSSDTLSILTRFRLPEQENEAKFPMIAIDLVDISEATDRNMRGRLNVSNLHYDPMGEALVTQDGHSAIADFPIPVNLDYQVQTLVRQAYQDRILQGMVWSICPGRFGVLRVKDTDRTMQLLGSTDADRIDEQGKRTFRKVYTIRVVSELFPSLIKQVATLTNITIYVPVLWPVDVANGITEMDCNAEN